MRTRTFFFRDFYGVLRFYSCISSSPLLILVRLSTNFIFVLSFRVYFELKLEFLWTNQEISLFCSSCLFIQQSSPLICFTSLVFSRMDENSLIWYFLYITFLTFLYFLTKIYFTLIQFDVSYFFLNILWRNMFGNRNLDQILFVWVLVSCSIITSQFLFLFSLPISKTTKIDTCSELEGYQDIHWNKQNQFYSAHPQLGR